MATFGRIGLFVSFLIATACAKAAARVDLPAGLLHPIATEHLTADGKLVASRLPDGQVLLCDAATRKPLATIRAADSLLTALAVAPDGKSIATPTRLLGRDGTELVKFTLRDKGEVRSLAYSPDGRYVAAGREDGRVCLISTTTGREIMSLEGHKHPVGALAFSPDARLLAAVGVDGTLRLWELASGVEVWHMPDAAPNGRLAFDAAGRVLFQADAAECVVTSRDAATGKEASRRTLSGLSLEPAELILAKGEKKTLRVVAKWSDGAEDVTRQSVFTTADGDAATIAPSGEVRADHPGRCVVAARFFGRTAAANVFVPFAALDKPIVFEPRNFIDEIALARWKKLNVVPAGAAPDHVFLRRAYLTLIGRPPTPDEVGAFRKDTNAKKRVKLIDALLDRPQYADYWTEQWVALLGADAPTIGEKGAASFHSWLHKAIADNRPLDRIAQELLTSDGAAIGLIGSEPQKSAALAAQVFLGADLRCAECHAAPGEGWGRDAPEGLAAVFARARLVDKALKVDPKAMLTHPRTGKIVAPRLPGEPPLKLDGDEDPRAAFARWLTAKDNRVLARTFVNRYWAVLFSRGLREPSEGTRSANVPIYPELLDALTEDFVKSGYDVKHLLRTMAVSRLFEMDNKQPVADATDVLLARHVPQRIPERVMQRCFKQAVGVPAEVPLSSNAEAFGRLSSDDLSRCAYADAQGGRVLAFVPSLGSDMKPFTDPKGAVAHLLKSKATDEAILEELFLLALSRTATEKETKAVLDHLQKNGAGGRKEALVDILWALSHSKEFLLIP